MRVSAVACDARGEGCLTLTPDDALETTILGHSSDGRTIYVRKRRTIGATSIVAADRRTGVALRTLSPADSSSRNLAFGEWLPIYSFDGLKLPTYRWSSRRGQPSSHAVVVYVSGAKQQLPNWEKQYPYLLGAGIDLVLASHRGRSGYGATLEQATGGEDAKVRDIVATVRFVIDSLHVPADNVLLFGHSAGALLAARAAAQLKDVTHVILASMPSDSIGVRADHRGAPKCAVMFHGELDPVSPADARATAESILGAGASKEPCGHFEVFPGEPHVYERARSWSTVFAAMVTMLRRRQGTPR
jgi:dienelactone hydrolase